MAGRGRGGGRRPDRWNRIRYGLYAPVYDPVARLLRGGRSRAVELLAAEEGDRILLVGCGTGLDLEHLPRGIEATALDVAPSMVRRARRRGTESGRPVAPLVGDAASLPFADDAFDAVLLHLLLSVVPHPRAAAAEAARVLAPGGRVSIFDKFVPEGREPSALRRLLNPLARFLFSDITRRLGPILEGTGLRVEERERVVGGLYTAAVARPVRRRSRAG